MGIEERALARVQQEHRTTYVSFTGTWSCSCGAGNTASLVGSGFRTYERPPGLQLHLTAMGKKILKEERG